MKKIIRLFSQNINPHLTGALKIITLCFGIIILSSNYVSALTYRDGVNVQFTFEPALSISLSSANLTIGNLVPGNYDSSNTITVSVDTNSVVGYTLAAKVGGTGQTAANSNLVNTLANTAFTSIANDATTTLANFADNKWGYTTAGTIESSTTFSGLLYDEDTIINATTNVGGTAATGYTGTNTTSFTIGARAAADQAAGEYTNVITFTAVANEPPEPNTYIQDLTLANCPAEGMTVYDKRDETAYTVRKLADGNCWMTQNLALDLTALTQAQLYGTGNDAGKMTNASNTTLGYLKNGGGSSPYTGTAVALATSTNSYTVPFIAKSGTCYNAYCVDNPSSGNWSYDATFPSGLFQGKIGIYYNYCAATAGSYCYSESSSTGNATEDICPYGWHLPAGDQAQGSFYYLYKTGYSTNYTNFVTALSTPLSGYFSNGMAYAQGGRYSYGYFWSSTLHMGGYMYGLQVGTGSLSTQSTLDRYFGRSVRCVRTS